MIPHSTELQDLTSTILLAQSHSDILSAILAVDSIILHLSPDLTRRFFSLTFPSLICKLFGFEDSKFNGWIEIPQLSKTLFDLLSPNGTLFQSILACDRLNLVKYVFPIERLPEWVKFALSSDKDRALVPELSTLFKSRVKDSSGHLNVFEYYMFWFAYYPICTPILDNTNLRPTPRNGIFRFPAFRNTHVEQSQKGNCSLYVKLVYAYLCAYVPICDSNAQQPYGNSLLQYPPGYDGLVVLNGLPSEFFVNTLIHFWLSYNDFSPLSINGCKLHGVLFPLKTVLFETPPNSGLGQVVKLFVKYLSMSSGSHIELPDSSSGLISSGRNSTLVSPCVRSWNLYVQRPLYRFILRTFLFHPMGSNSKNASEVFLVWISYIEPWATSMEDFSELHYVMDKSGSSASKKDDFKPVTRGYTLSWQDYVLSNYLFYSSMFIHFIGFAHKFLHTDPEAIVGMVSKVIHILTSSNQLIELIKNMDTVCHAKQAVSGKLMLNGLYRFVPQIREQLQDWEDGLCEISENMDRDLRLFSDIEDGGHQLLQLFILRAESELEALSSANLAQNLQGLDSLKSKLSSLFGVHIVNPLRAISEPMLFQKSREEIFTPRKIEKCTSNVINYKGDWMKRPISDDEIAWLAKSLIWLSGWLNEKVGLNRGHTCDVSPTESFVTVLENVCEPMEITKLFLCSIWSMPMMGGLGVLRLMRRYELRVNLRALASKKIVIGLLVVVAVSVILRKAFGIFQLV